MWGTLQMERVRKSERERERDCCEDWMVDIISWAQGLRGGNVMLFLSVSSLLPVWMSSPSLASSWAWTSFPGQCNQKNEPNRDMEERNWERYGQSVRERKRRAMKKREREGEMRLARRSVGSQECSGVGIKLSAHCRGTASVDLPRIH